MKKLIFALLLMLPSMAYGFSDLPQNHKNFEAVSYLKEKGVIGGYEDGSFRPNATINRAELVKILIESKKVSLSSNAAKLNCFPDVQTQWFAPFICEAKEKSWIAGYPSGLFSPEKPVNRAEALKILFNAFEVVTPKYESQSFEDVAKDQWFFGFAEFAREKNILEQQGKFLRGEENLTRGEFSEMMYRMIQVDENSGEVFVSWPKDWVESEMKTLELLNQLRAEDGKAALKINEKLSSAAREHARDMAENLGKISHFSSDGRTAHERIRESGAVFNGASAENVGVSTFFEGDIFSGVKQVHLEIFMKEPDEGINHKTTLLSRSFAFSEVGIGVYVKGNKVYFSTKFIEKKME
jgi:uncharacterized protein YkwD